MKHAPISRLALYVRDMNKVADFYSRHFGFSACFSAVKDKAVLRPPNGGCRLVLLQGSRGHRIGQSCVKIVFDVQDVRKAKARHAVKGLKFGPIHRGPGYEFANARDPARNLIQISSAYLVDC